MKSRGRTLSGVISITFLISTLFAQSQTPAFNWATNYQASGGSPGGGIAVAVDQQRNSYVTGSFSGPGSFGSTSLTNSSGGGSDIFVSKHDPAGNVVWAVSAGSPGRDDYGSGVAPDGNGNVFVTGVFTGYLARFGNTMLTNSASWGADDNNGFLAKYDSAGQLLWVRQFGGEPNGFANIQTRAIVTDNSGNCYVTGSFSGDLFIGDIHLTTSSVVEEDFFLAKFSPDGAMLWVKQAGGSSYYDWANGLAIDPVGNLYLSGFFYGPATFGTINLPGIDEADVFISKYSSEGDCIWAKQFGGIGYEFGLDVAVDEDGNSFLAGHFGRSDLERSITFGTTTLTNHSTNFNDHAIFVAKLDASGEPVWAQQIDGNFEKNVWSVSCDPDGNVCVAGNFHTQVTAGGLSATTTNYPSGFLVKYDKAGELRWLKTVNASNRGSVTDNEGNSYFTGAFTRTATFDEITVTAEIGKPIYIAKLGSDAPELTITQLADQSFISWRTNRVGWSLESCENLYENNWSIVPFGTSNGRNCSTNLLSGTNKFFRLRK